MGKIHGWAALIVFENNLFGSAISSKDGAQRRHHRRPPMHGRIEPTDTSLSTRQPVLSRTQFRRTRQARIEKGASSAPLPFTGGPLVF
jgi:hypothetical protein